MPTVQFLKRVAFATPIVFTFHSCVGSISKVSGASMQQTLNPTEFPNKAPWFNDHGPGRPVR